MKKRFLSMVLIMGMAGAMLAGCGGSGDEKADAGDSGSESSGSKDTIRIGVRSDGIDQLEVVRDKIEAAGYTVEESVFDDSIQPILAPIKHIEQIHSHNRNRIQPHDLIKPL